MIRIRRKKFICLFLATLFCLFALRPLFSIEASAVTQAEIDELEEKKEEIKEKKKAQQAIVDALEGEHADFLELKKALDDRNAFTLEQMDLNQQQIDLYAAIIYEKSLEVEAARAVEQEQMEKYRTRIRAMEENGNYNILAIFLNASSLGELLTVMDDMGEIMDSDKKLEDDYILAREKVESVMAEYESVKVELDAKQAKLEEEQSRLQAQLDETEQMIVDLKNSIDSESETLDEIERIEAETQAQIDELTEELERQRRAAIAAAAGATSYTGGGTVTGSGSFIWPVSCTYITSCVGNRLHPISGVWKYHSGMDIGCQYGDSVWASDGGTVCIADWNGGYGNCVMIDHNNGYYTLYGHLSSIVVSVNQTVSQGQVVGYVGSTGMSTGPHLHFEIRSGSSCLDFASWFSGLTYAPDSGG